MPGPHRITVSPALAGTTITLTRQLPIVTRDGIILSGPTTIDGRPSVTIDGRQIDVTTMVTRGALTVLASRFQLRGLRLAGIAQAGGVLLLIRAGRVPFFGMSVPP